jgi:ribosome-binding factor A
MSERLKQVNELLRSELALALNRYGVMPDALITIAKVKCSSDLKNATVVVSVLPENKSGSALKLLRQNSALLARSLSKLKIKYIPRLNWKIDSQARFASETDRFFNELKST